MDSSTELLPVNNDEIVSSVQHRRDTAAGDVFVPGSVDGSDSEDPAVELNHTGIVEEEEEEAETKQVLDARSSSANDIKVTSSQTSNKEDVVRYNLSLYHKTQSFERWSEYCVIEKEGGVRDMMWTIIRYPFYFKWAVFLEVLAYHVLHPLSIPFALGIRGLTFSRNMQFICSCGDKVKAPLLIAFVHVSAGMVMTICVLWFLLDEEQMESVTGVEVMIAVMAFLLHRIQISYKHALSPVPFWKLYFTQYLPLEIRDGLQLYPWLEPTNKIIVRELMHAERVTGIDLHRTTFHVTEELESGEKNVRAPASFVAMTMLEAVYNPKGHYAVPSRQSFSLVLAFVQAMAPISVRLLQEKPVFPDVMVTVLVVFNWLVTFFYSMILFSFSLTAIMDFKRRSRVMQLMRLIIKEPHTGMSTMDNTPDVDEEGDTGHPRTQGIQEALKQGKGGRLNGGIRALSLHSKQLQFEERVKQEGQDETSEQQQPEEDDPHGGLFNPRDLRLDLTRDDNISSWVSTRKVVRQFGMHYRKRLELLMSYLLVTVTVLMLNFIIDVITVDESSSLRAIFVANVPTGLLTLVALVLLTLMIMAGVDANEEVFSTVFLLRSLQMFWKAAANKMQDLGMKASDKRQSTILQTITSAAGGSSKDRMRGRMMPLVQEEEEEEEYGNEDPLTSSPAMRHRSQLYAQEFSVTPGSSNSKYLQQKTSLYNNVVLVGHTADTLLAEQNISPVTVLGIRCSVEVAGTLASILFSAVFALVNFVVRGAL